MFIIDITPSIYYQFYTNVFSPDYEYHSQAHYFQHFSYYPSFFLPVQILIILSSSSLLQQFNFSSNINSHIIFSQYYLLTYLFSNDCIFQFYKWKFYHCYITDINYYLNFINVCIIYNIFTKII